MKAMLKLANNKFEKMVEFIYQIKKGEEVDLDKMLNLINSIHEDEISLIVGIHNIEQNKKLLELDIPSFMK